MDEIKKAVRNIRDAGKRGGREMDGHTLSDDVGNAGDDVRRTAANARDEAHSSAKQTHSRTREEADRSRSRGRGSDPS